MAVPEHTKRAEPLPCQIQTSCLHKRRIAYPGGWGYAVGAVGLVLGVVAFFNK